MEQMQNALRDVLGKYPDLGEFGFGRKADEGIPSVRHFARAVEFLRLMPRREAVNRDFDSYALKHGAERHGGAYVANGALIAAAIHLGFIVEPTGRNALINAAASSKWPTKAEC